jgi:cytochrome c peroxidase
VNRGKGPVLRGLAARAPYFHNGASTNLEKLVNFYNNRFAMELSDEQKKQPIAFLCKVHKTEWLCRLLA